MNIIKYIDFNNKIYTISEFSIQYFPTEPNYNSSEAASKEEMHEQEINKDVYKEIEKIALRIVRNKSIHVSKRKMLTVVVSITNEEASFQCIISRGKDQKDLEQVLKKYLD